MLELSFCFTELATLALVLGLFLGFTIAKAVDEGRFEQKEIQGSPKPSLNLRCFADEVLEEVAREHDVDDVDDELLYEHLLPKALNQNGLEMACDGATPRTIKLSPYQVVLLSETLESLVITYIYTNH